MQGASGYYKPPNDSTRLDGWIIRERIGRGKTSVVYRVGEPEDRLVAKIYRHHADEPDKYLDEWRAEVRNLLRFAGPHTPVIKHVSAITGISGEDAYLHPCVIMEDAGVSVSKHVKKNGALSEALAKSIAADTCKGLAAIHSAGLLHADIKPGNILLLDGHAKLGDLAAIVDPSDPEESACGTVPYWAPEFLYSEPRESPIDLWALGATYFYMITGSVLFDVYAETHTFYGGGLDEYGLLEDGSEEGSGTQETTDTSDVIAMCRLSAMYHCLLGSPPSEISRKMRGYYDSRGRPHHATREACPGTPQLLAYLRHWDGITHENANKILRALLQWKPEDRPSAGKAQALFVPRKARKAKNRA